MHSNLNSSAILTSFRLEELDLYKKKTENVCYIKSVYIEKEGKIIRVPTLEGEVVIEASDDIYIMLGSCDDVYPIPKELFEKKYVLTGNNPDQKMIDFIISLGWDPRFLRQCRLGQESYIYAKSVPYDFKVFVKHCSTIINGKKGDYYAVTYEDTENVYIVRADIMNTTYERL